MAYKRTDTLILILLVSLPALFFYYIYLLTHFKVLARVSFSVSWYGYLILTSGMLAWLFLIWMGIAWARNLHLSKVIPIMGTVLASIGLSPFIRGFDPIILLALPAFIFAIYLCRWHWQQAC